MIKLLSSVLLVGLTACSSKHLPATSDAAEDVQVMIIGTDHFDNPGQDLINNKAVNVLLPHRQQELGLLTKALLDFSPTMVAVESQTKAPSYTDDNYTNFTPEQLTTKANETIQLGYRIASLAKLTQVFGIDEQPSKSEPDYFPFDRVQQHLAKTGQTEQFTALYQNYKNKLEGFSLKQNSLSMTQILIEINKETSFISKPNFYYEVMEFDQGEQQPGAELYAYYMMRNAKIFSKLMDITKPGDRVIVIYGAGHKYWLEHLIKFAPGYKVIDPIPYLLKVTN